jgi:catechol 2,3-dioxygenase-like lactoylglutathione lyase family enzyme
MTKTRTGDTFMSAGEHGRALPKFSVNLVIRNVAKSVPFYREVLGATVRYWDNDFAALSLLAIDCMLHADHAYDHHPRYAPLVARQRGVGAELRFLGINPEQVGERANRAGATIIQPAKDFAHGWRHPSRP